MAKKQPKKLVQDTRDDFARLQEELESALATRKVYQRELDNARKRLKRRDSEDRATTFAIKLIQALKKGNILETTLVTEIDKAIETNQEFIAEAYIKPLYEVAKEKEIFKLLPFGTGWGTHLNTQIVFEEKAGDIADWGQAVTDYREFELKTKRLDDFDAGQRASSWFATHVLDFPLHDKTIAGRLSYTPAVAPFWRILNSGDSPMISDREGGYSVANNRTTDFIGDAERAINKQFSDTMIAEHAKVIEEEGEISELIAEYEEKRDQYSQEVKKLRTEVKLNEQIYKSFGDKKDYVDRDLLAKAIRSLEKKRGKRDFDIARAGSGQSLIIAVRRAEGVIEY